VDLTLFYAIHGLVELSERGDFLIIFFAQWYFYGLLLVFAYAAWRDYRVTPVRLYSYAVALSAAIIARFGLAEAIRYFYHHERPFVALGVSHLITDTAYSFPSGHAVFIFALGAAAHFFNKKLAYFLYVSGLIIGFARVAAGVHYPSDILGGIVLGVAVGASSYLLAKKFFPLVA
jgi:membrane-associated phospholipid phosphatase